MGKLKNKVEAALVQDNSIVCGRDKVNETQPRSESYFEMLGLSRSDLKKLERAGLATRRYTKNTWIQGETLPNGTKVEEGKIYHGQGRRIAWILLAD